MAFAGRSPSTGAAFFGVPPEGREGVAATGAGVVSTCGNGARTLGTGALPEPVALGAWANAGGIVGNPATSTRVQTRSSLSMPAAAPRL